MGKVAVAEGQRTLRAGFVGRVPYAEAVSLQERLRDDLRHGRGPETFLLLEHPHVFTVGRNADRADVLAPDAWLEGHGVTVHTTARGGQVTYHGPGQLVGYPILDLNPDRRDIRRYVHDLQEVMIRTLADFGVEAGRRDGPEHIGVWAEGGKIASIGVHLKRWLTSHGFALNVTTDLEFFGAIVACGLPDVRMVSIESLTGTRFELEEVAARAAHHLAEIFGRRLEPLPAGV
ncbi:MAG: lipoyl(octanoyl) transferase LipB [Acidobacteria bacterium]|nr:lipoyl(octanoyl) transferase LipB [Acidobacteriota bacterium]